MSEEKGFWVWQVVMTGCGRPHWRPWVKEHEFGLSASLPEDATPPDLVLVIDEAQRACDEYEHTHRLKITRWRHRLEIVRVWIPEEELVDAGA